MVDGGDGDLRAHAVAGADRGEELQRLAEIDGAVARKLLSDDRRDQAGGEHAMGDAALEDRVERIVLVKVDRVAVGRDLGEKLDIPVGYGLLEMAGHADFHLFDDDGAAWHVVEHPLNLCATKLCRTISARNFIALHAQKVQRKEGQRSWPAA